MTHTPNTLLVNEERLLIGQGMQEADLGRGVGGEGGREGWNRSNPASQENDAVEAWTQVEKQEPNWAKSTETDSGYVCVVSGRGGG